jgi:hypothetical protein
VDLREAWCFVAPVGAVAAQVPTLTVRPAPTAVMYGDAPYFDAWSPPLLQIQVTSVSVTHANETFSL